MRKHNGKDLLIAFGLLFIVFSCLHIVSGTVMAQPKEVKIGLLYSTSGPLASIGRLIINGHEMAVREINAKGGIKSLGGAKLVLVPADAESKPEIAMSATEKLITKDNVVAIVGPYSSGEAFASTQIAEKYKTPTLLCGPVADQITERGFKYTFRTVYKATENAKAALDFMKYIGEKTGVKPKTVALLYEDTLWGQSSSKSWKSLMPSYGYQIVADLPYSKAAQDITPTISRLKAAKPDVVLQISYTTDAILVTRTMFDLDFNCMGRIPTGGGHTDTEYQKAMGKLMEYIIINLHYHPTLRGPNNKNQIVNERFKKQYGIDMDDYSAPAYDLMWVVADALERAGSIDREKVRNAIAATNLTIDNSPVIRPMQYKFDENGQAPATGVFAQYQNQKLLCIWPEKYAASKPIWPMPTWKERHLR